MQHQDFSSARDRDLEEAKSLVGTTVANRWKISRLLGTGGTAAVYAASHVNNGRHAAIKVLHRSVAHSEDMRERFFEEAFAANRIDHPGTVPALDDGTLQDGRPFLVLELLEGESVHTMWDRRGRALPVLEVLQIGRSVLSVVGAAHEKGILHRDIKPENLFMSANGELKLLDFGIAKMTNSQRSYTTRIGDTMGTPAFMPPEQARGRWGEVDERSDLWAVSATLFTLLTGKFIHEAGTTNEILLSAMCNPAPPIRTLHPGIPEAVARVIDRGLSFEKSERFASAREMYDALDDCLAQLPPKGSEPPPRSARRRIIEGHNGAFETVEIEVEVPMTHNTTLTQDLVIPTRKTPTVAVVLALFVAVVGVFVWSRVSVSDVQAAFLQQPHGIFTHLPGDPVLQADTHGPSSSGTFGEVMSAKRVILSEDGQALSERQILSLHKANARSEPLAPALEEELPPDSDVALETPQSVLEPRVDATATDQEFDR